MVTLVVTQAPDQPFVKETVLGRRLPAPVLVSMPQRTGQAHESFAAITPSGKPVDTSQLPFSTNTNRITMYKY
jgi:hypothetical protein